MVDILWHLEVYIYIFMQRGGRALDFKLYNKCEIYT